MQLSSFDLFPELPVRTRSCTFHMSTCKSKRYFNYLFVLLLFFLFFFLTVLGLSLVLASYSLAAVLRLLMAVASLIAEDGLQGAQDSVVVAQGRSYPEARAVFLDQGSNPCPCIDREFLTPEPPGKSQYSNLLHFISENKNQESFCHSPYPIHHRFYELCLQSIS